MLSGEDNFYAYVSDINSWIDPFGLEVLRNELVYQLLDADDKIVYYGITRREALVRLGEHEDSDKVFVRMEIIAENLTHDEACSLEGNLIRIRLRQRAADWNQDDSIEDRLKNSGLQNKNRGREKDKWTIDGKTKSIRPKEG